MSNDSGLSTAANRQQERELSPPQDIDGNRLVHDGNPASLPGMMHEIFMHEEREDIYQLLI